MSNVWWIIGIIVLCLIAFIGYRFYRFYKDVMQGGSTNCSGANVHPKS